MASPNVRFSAGVLNIFLIAFLQTTVQSSLNGNFDTVFNSNVLQLCYQAAEDNRTALDCNQVRGAVVRCPSAALLSRATCARQQVWAASFPPLRDPFNVVERGEG